MATPPSPAPLIPRVAYVDRATLTELATAREAAIVTGLGTSWPAREQWATAAGLCEAANQHLGRVYSQQRDHFAFDDRSKPFAVLGPSQRRPAVGLWLVHIGLRLDEQLRRLLRPIRCRMSSRSKKRKRRRETITTWAPRIFL